MSKQHSDALDAETIREYLSTLEWEMKRPKRAGPRVVANVDCATDFIPSRKEVLSKRKHHAICRTNKANKNRKRLILVDDIEDSESSESSSDTDSIRSSSDEDDDYSDPGGGGAGTLGQYGMGGDSGPWRFGGTEGSGQGDASYGQHNPFSGVDWHQTLCFLNMLFGNTTAVYLPFTNGKDWSAHTPVSYSCSPFSCSSNAILRRVFSTSRLCTDGERTLDTTVKRFIRPLPKKTSTGATDPQLEPMMVTERFGPAARSFQAKGDQSLCREILSTSQSSRRLTQSILGDEGTASQVPLSLSKLSDMRPLLLRNCYPIDSIADSSVSKVESEYQKQTNLFSMAGSSGATLGSKRQRSTSPSSAGRLTLRERQQSALSIIPKKTLNFDDDTVRRIYPLEIEQIAALEMVKLLLEAVVKLLLEKGAVLKSESKNFGQTPLSWAAYNGHEEMVKLLLEKGAKLESKDMDGQTPLSWAACNGDEEVVKLLLEKGAELEWKDKNGQTPLSWAAYNGHEAVVNLLLEKGAELESKDKNSSQTPLCWAVKGKHEAVVRLLLEKGAELEPEDKDFGQTPLSWAAYNGHEEMVKLLLEKGAELESEDKNFGQTPLCWAVKGKHEAVVRLLLEKGAELESEDKDFGQTPLSWAAYNGHEEMVKLLLEKGAELESKDKDGRTPLSWAAYNEHETVVKLLLEKGAKLESKDKKYGQTPLSWAAD